MTERSKLVNDLEAAVSLAKDALASSADALGSSRRTQDRVRRAMRDAAATVADVDTVAGPGATAPASD